MNNLKGIYIKEIYSNRENGYLVGLIKIKECENEELINKTITFTGNFTDLNIDDNLYLEGNMNFHYKYGEQLKVNYYEKIMPSDENSIVNFLKGDLFKGIGEAKAQNIYDHFKEETINIILNNPTRLLEVKGLTKNNIEILHNKMLDYEENIDILLKLTEYGFSSIESNILYKKYKNKILDIIDHNIYDLIDDNLSFRHIDHLAIKREYNILDIRRVKASIIYLMKELCFSLGNTYLTIKEIYNNIESVLVSKIDEDLFMEAINSLIMDNLIILENECYYLKEYYEAETNIAKRLVYLNNKKDIKNKNLDNLVNYIEDNLNIQYNDLQKKAIIESMNKNLLIITGGPGTGKTTIIKAICKLYKELMKYNDKDLMEDLVLLAPTGRASKRIMESVNLPSQTIHRFLKWNKESNKFAVNERNKSNVKIVIIDEFSMVDTLLFDSLLKGLKYDTKIIIVGDYHQLPSVYPGNLLKDLINLDLFNVVTLENLYRQSENSNIISLAYDIKNGIVNGDYFNNNDDLTFIKTDSYSLIDNLAELITAYKDYSYNNIQVMAPMYKTLNGIDNLNIIIQNILNKKDKDKNEIVINDTLYREGDKVLQLINMPDLNIYNGDIGIIKEIDNIKKEILIDFDDNLVTFNKSNFKNFRLGYTISIHKSQGSEFNIVIIPLLDEYGRMLYRKLLYTGVTRAKSKLFILGEYSAYSKAVNVDYNNERKTSINYFIENMYKTNLISE